MNYFSAGSLLVLVSCFVLNWIILRSGRTKLFLSWAFFNFAVGFWGYCAFLIGFLTDKSEAHFWWSVSHIGIGLIPVALLHTVYLFCGARNRFLLRVVYIQALFFIVIALSGDSLFIADVVPFDGFYFIKAGPLYYFFLAIWLLIILHAHFRLFLEFKGASGIRKNQIKYFFIGFLFGFVGGVTNFFPVLGLNIIPFGNFTIPLYCLVVTYAILKYRLLDITVAVTRTSVFVVVYSIILGFPFALAFGGQDRLFGLLGEIWWIVPMLVSTVLATSGPYVYGFIQKRAEDSLLQEQRQYQSTLRHASLGMGRIKNLKRLLNLIVHIVTRAVRVEHCEIFLLHEDSEQFALKASKGKNEMKNRLSVLSPDTVLVKYLKEKREPLVYDEIRQMSKDFNDNILIQLEAMIRALDAALLIPSYIEDKLLAIFVLGKKKSGKLYSQDDLAVFSILANQSALAIENAIFYEDMKKTHEQLFKAEKMATIGTMADGLSHQINNRLHAMGFIAGDALDTINLRKNSDKDEEIIEDMKDALERIQDNVKRGGEIVGGLLKYTRKGEEGFTAVDFSELLDASIEMAQFKIKLSEINLERNFNSTVPQILGNFTQLQEVFFNIIDNSYDAMMQRKVDLEEESFKGRLEITAEKKGKKIEIIFKDNGMGVKKEDTHKLFTPFFTTKLSSKKGTGLGLYVIQKIIEENHNGKVAFTSDFKKGSQTKITLPIAEDSEQS